MSGYSAAKRRMSPTWESFIPFTRVGTSTMLSGPKSLQFSMAFFFKGKALKPRVLIYGSGVVPSKER